MPTASAENASKAPSTSPFRLIEPIEIAQTVWTSWCNDPDGKDALGDSTYNRVHFYNPEELQVDIDGVVNTRGGAEKIREMYKSGMWAAWEPRIRAGLAASQASKQ
jgi:hypothetical protein